MVHNRVLYFSLAVLFIFYASNVTVESFFFCNKNQVKLLSIFNLLCNSTQVASVQLRDACQSCFYRAVSLPPGSAQLQGLGYCATVFLNATGYQRCASRFAAIALQARPVQSVFTLNACAPGYCEFVQCIRRTNANILVNACFLANLVNRDFNQIGDRINFFTNTTACILAKVRCGALNPINGELQQQLNTITNPGLTNNAGTAGYFHYNALQIAPNGDIKVVAFPSAYVVGDYFCTNSANLAQSNFDNSTCIFNI